jgi:hypothetical protein
LVEQIRRRLVDENHFGVVVSAHELEESEDATAFLRRSAATATSPAADPGQPPKVRFTVWSNEP